LWRSWDVAWDEERKTASVPLYSDRQIALIRESGRIVAECLDLVRQHVRPGVTTRQLDEVVTEHIKKRGATSPFFGYEFPGKTPFPAYVCASVNDVVVHGLPDDVELKEGDLVSIDVGACKDGYIGDSAWTFPVGEPDAVAKKLLAAGEESLYAGLNAMRPKGRISDISRAVQNLVESRGFSVVRDYVGHGVGQTLHEEPQVPNYVQTGTGLLSVFKNDLLKPGMVLAVEPMVNEGSAQVVSVKGTWPVRTADGGRSVHFEHTIAVLSDRVEILTKL
jgi:methionyl aminopeptidase